MTESQAPAEREEPPRWQIGQLAALAATTARAIRLYEAAGLLPEPARSAGGYRLYGPADLATLIRIRRLRGLGFPDRADPGPSLAGGAGRPGRGAGGAAQRYSPRRRQPGADRGPGPPAGGPERCRQDHAAARAGRPGAANRGLGQARPLRAVASSRQERTEPCRSSSSWLMSLGRLCRIVRGAGERGYLRFGGARECRDVPF